MPPSQYADLHIRLVGGINPHMALPVVLDVGTNNEELLNDDLYVVCLDLCRVMPIHVLITLKGWPHKRVRGEEYNQFVDR